ncbi:MULTISPECIES: GbsR/MarR family transcriptional regulator [Amycolatopsis]|uniref:DNA-binding transcriptional regulator GbsR, MarR family n=2 Tax=Amycolatopsis TaxID=1813 RepID=A0A1I3L2B6_9PSEU|nr:MarR family transcriptional regulator [Amycolatopsis sacchari]SFI78545.1 DNA-binding transcriptional regulator GbsR, MarR family [Amycolatopsis sacchari]
MTEGGAVREDERDEVSRFAERFAATLTDTGFPRLAARVFATLLVSESGRMTAAELSGRLRASTGGVSGAVRYLVQLRLIRTERDPGTRRHAYVVDSSWYESTVTANPFLERGEADLREGIAVLGESPAADRLTETLELIQFLKEETRAMMRRWHERKAAPRTRRTAGRA